MSDREYREKADELLMLLQADSISYPEYNRRQSKLVADFYESKCNPATATQKEGRVRT